MTNLKDLIIYILIITIGSLLPARVLAQSPPIFQESGGVVIIEIESAQNFGLWELQQDELGYTGEGYLHYKGPNHYNAPGNSLLKFEIKIEKTGKYRFQWHSLIAIGESNTEHNDSWLRFQDASDFYGEKDGQKVFPKGVGKTPNPNGSSFDGWLKIYQNNQNNWTWVTRTSDHDPHEIYVEFDTIGIYTIEISGRSNGHAINRIALYHNDVSSSYALDLAQSESQQILTVATKEVQNKTLLIRPTLARNSIIIDIPETISTGIHYGQIINFNGQSLKWFSFHTNSGNENVNIPITDLEDGIYLIRFQERTDTYQAKFIKQ